MRHNAGFSMLEVMVAGTILSAIMMATLTFMNTLTEAASVEKKFASMLQAADRGAETVTDAFRMARVVALGSAATGTTPVDGNDSLVDGTVQYNTDGIVGGDSVIFQFPLRINGDSVDENLEAVWGAKIGKDPMPGYVAVFRYAATQQFNETERDVDLDKNGLREMLNIGRIERLVFESAAMVASGEPLQTEVVTPEIVVQHPADPLADLDADGQPDPLFSVESQIGDSRTIRIKVMFADPSFDFPMMHRASTAVELQNQL